MRQRTPHLILCLTASVLLKISPAFAQGQDGSLSITRDADSLMAKLLQTPQDVQLQRKLIDEYVRTSNPELALVEIGYAESFGLADNASTELKGKVQANLEEIVPAVNNLERAYLLHPRDDVLLTIALLQYARGQRDLGHDILRRLKTRVQGLSVDLLNQYEKYYLNDRTVVARAISDALRDLDPVSFETFFPSPRVTILSPADNVATEAKNLSVIFEVRHARPIKKVTIQGAAVYERDASPVTSVNEEFNKSFTQLVELSEGVNTIPVVVTDIFGIETVRSLTVNSTSFGLRTDWRSPLTDTLRSEILTLRSYVNESEFKVDKKNSYRTLIVAGARGADSASFFDRGLFMYELFTHPLIGYTSERNAKLLVGDRVRGPNVSLLSDEWLVKGSTFQSLTTIYLCGRWSIRPGEWVLNDIAGGKVDVKPILERLSQVASAGITLVCDGRIDDRKTLEAGLTLWAHSSTVPISVFVMPENGAWCRTLSHNIATPLASMTAGGFFTSWDFEQLAEASATGNEKKTLFYGQSPARKLVGEYFQLLTQLGQKLTAAGVAEPVKARLMSFSKDWRRYSEVVRYLHNELSLEDFVARADDFFARNPNENGLSK
jgi:hypothetical protein